MRRERSPEEAFVQKNRIRNTKIRGGLYALAAFLCIGLI